MGFRVRSTTAKVVYTGSRRTVRNVFVSSSGVGEHVSFYLNFWKQITNWGTVFVASYVIT